MENRIVGSLGIECVEAEPGSRRAHSKGDTHRKEAIIFAQCGAGGLRSGAFLTRGPNSICERLAFLADAYGSNINAAPAISVGTRAPRKRYSGEIPASPKRDARID